MEKYYLWLVLALGEAEPTVSRLLKRFGNAKSVYEAFKSNIAAAGSKLIKKASAVTLDKAEKELDLLNSKGISVIIPENELFPAALKAISEPPCLLFAKGNTALLKSRLLTAVGARAATSDTAALQDSVIRSLAEKYTLVSTLSVGCDQTTCLCAMKYKVPFIEVMPCGFDKEYPSGSDTLRRFMLDNGGLIISEFLPRSKSSQGSFIHRSRIIGGISPAALIFQAGRKSGALRTAEMSHHPYFIPPLDIFNKNYAGSVIAVRRGASLYFSPDDLETAYDVDFSSPEILKRNISFSVTKSENKNSMTASFGTSPVSESETEKSPEIREISRDDFETALHYDTYVLIAENKEPIAFDNLLHKSEADITELSEVLLDLEIEGLIAAAPGSRYKLV